MDLNKYSTARAGILQSAAYRNLQHFMASQLEDHGVTMPEWGLLGLVAERPELGVSASELATLMKYNVSHVTNLINDLESSGLVHRTVNKQDRRNKRVILTDSGLRFVESTERQIRNSMKKWLKGINKVELLSYGRVLKKISELDSNLTTNKQ